MRIVCPWMALSTSSWCIENKNSTRRFEPLTSTPVIYELDHYTGAWFRILDLACWHTCSRLYIILVPFSFFLSFRLVVFRLFLVSPSSLIISLPCFPWWRILLLCYFVSALHPPPRSLRAEVCVFPLRAVSSCVVDVDLFLFLLPGIIFISSLPSLFQFLFGHCFFFF